MARQSPILPTREFSPHDVALSVRLLARGFTENWVRATLAAGSTSTEVDVTAAGPDANVMVIPQSASAVAVNPFVARGGDIGAVTISHDSSSATDMQVCLVVIQ